SLQVRETEFVSVSHGILGLSPESLGSPGSTVTAWWAGRTQTSNQLVMGSMSRSLVASIFGCHAQREQEDDRRKDWLSAANRSVMLSSWGSASPGSCPAGAGAEVGLRWWRRLAPQTPEDPAHVCDKAHRNPTDRSLCRRPAG